MSDGPLEVGGVRWWLAAAASPERTAPLLARALETLARGIARDQKSGRRKQLYPLVLGAGAEPDHLLKVNAYRALDGWLRRRSKARHELEVAEGLAARNVPTPLPLAAGERRRWGRLRACYLLVPWLSDVEDLGRLLLGGTPPPPAERRAVTRALGVFSRRAHEAGLFQDDFAPNNLLVRRGEPPQLFAVDFERARLRPQAASQAERRWMLAKLDRHLAPVAQASDRLRFLRSYCLGHPDEARRWWRALADFAPQLARRDLRHLRTTATRDGRRFRRLAHGGWRGFARRDAEPDELARRAAQAAGAGAGVRGDEAAWCVVYPRLGRRAAAALWSAAVLLSRRGGLVPAPLALLSRADASVLLLRRAPAAQRADGAGPEHPALRVLRRRLEAIGSLPGPLDPAAVALEPGPAGAARAALLDPRPWRPTG